MTTGVEQKQDADGDVISGPCPNRGAIWVCGAYEYPDTYSLENISACDNFKACVWTVWYSLE